MLVDYLTLVSDLASVTEQFVVPPSVTQAYTSIRLILIQALPVSDAHTRFAEFNLTARVFSLG